MNTKPRSKKRSPSKKSMTATAEVSPPSADELVKLGRELLAQQRAIRQAIPDFLMPHESRASLSGTPSRVTDVAIREGLAACAMHASLSGAIDPAAVLYRQNYEAAFIELRDELETTFLGLDYSIRSKRHQNGREMLRIAVLAENLAKSPENAGLKIYVEGIKKGFRRRRTTPAPETPAPETPAPAPAGEPPTTSQ